MIRPTITRTPATAQFTPGTSVEREALLRVAQEYAAEPRPIGRLMEEVADTSGWLATAGLDNIFRDECQRDRDVALDELHGHIFGTPLTVDINHRDIQALRNDTGDALMRQVAS